MGQMHNPMPGYTGHRTRCGLGAPALEEGRGASGRRFPIPGYAGRSRRPPTGRRLRAALAGVLLGAVPAPAAGSVPSDIETGDNWGAPTHSINSYRGPSLRELTAGCRWGYANFARRFKGATLHFYNSTEAWTNYRGHDMLDNSSDAHVNSYFKKFTRDYHATEYRSEILAGSCRVQDPSDAETAWVVQRVGPFRSRGNYDWWQFAWDDTFHTADLTQKYPEGIFITRHFTGAVDLSGDILGFPPIHVHHVHVSPGIRNPMRQDHTPCLQGDKVKCSNPFHVVFEQHGDYQCSDKDGGVSCLLEDLPANYGKLVTGPLTINGELNDVRGPNSPEITWWYQTAIQYIPKVIVGKRQDSSQLRPLSFHYMWSPGRFKVSDQSTMVNTFLAPTFKETFVWYTGEMLLDGDLVRAKMHTHNTIFDESYLFAGTRAQLGMDSSRFRPKRKAYDVMDPKEMGFESNAQLKRHIMDHYERSARSGSGGGGASPARLICHGRTNADDVAFDGESYKFDRRAPTYCKAWKIKKGEPFVAIGFNKHLGSPPGPHMPGVIPDWLPGHLHWFIMTDTHDGKSHYTYEFYNQDLGMKFGTRKDAVVPFGSKFNMGVFMWNKGMPSYSEWRNTLLGIIAALLAGSLVTILGLCFAIRRIAKRCKRE